MSVDGISLEAVLDVEGTLARFGGDQDLFRELAGMLLEDAPPLFNRLREAVARQDAEGVRMHAHALKGLVSNCGGNRAARVAQQLEDAGQKQNLEGAPRLVDLLCDELDYLTQAIDAYRAES